LATVIPLTDASRRPTQLSQLTLSRASSGSRLAQVAAGPSSAVPSLGASGAIAAVMGAFLVTYPRDRIRALLVIFIFVRTTFIPYFSSWSPKSSKDLPSDAGVRQFENPWASKPFF
jgi:Rhomboid family